MPFPIPICPLLKGEETVMMIIRLGSVFRLIPDSPCWLGWAGCAVCERERTRTHVCLADAILGSPKKARDDGPSLCFVCMASVHLPWKICHRSYCSLIFLGHLPPTCFPSSFHFNLKTQLPLSYTRLIHMPRHSRAMGLSVSPMCPLLLFHQ